MAWVIKLSPSQQINDRNYFGFFKSNGKMISKGYAIIGRTYSCSIAILFLVLIPLLGFSQNENNRQGIELNFSIGCSVQFFAFENFLLQPKTLRYSTRNRDFFLAGLGNEDGVGVPITLKVYDPRWHLGLTYEPIIRYDIIDVSPAGSYIPGVFIDHHFSLYHKFSFVSQLLPNTIKKPIPMYVGMGYSMMSIGQSYDFNWLLYDKQTQSVIEGSKVDLSFSGIHVFLGIHVYKGFHLETKFIHIPQNQIIYKLYQSTNMILIKGAYQITILKRK